MNAPSNADAPQPLPAPLVPAALGLVAGVGLSEWFGLSSVYPAAGVAVLGAIIVAFGKQGRRATIVALAIAAAAVGYCRHQSVLRLPENHVAWLASGDPILTRVAGRVVSAPTSTVGEKFNAFMPYDPPPRTRFVLEVEWLCAGAAPSRLAGLVRVTVEGEPPPLRLGDEVLLTGKLYRPPGRRNPGETDWAGQMRLQGIHAGLSVDSAALVERRAVRPSVIPRAITALRDWARQLLFEPTIAADGQDARAVLDSMVLGQRSAVGRRINDAFLRTGTIHFLSVSGAHVAALAVTLYFILRRGLGVGARITAALTCVAMLLYLAICEPNAPVLRATIMGVAACTAIMIGRPLSGLNWLALSAGLVLLRPLDLFQAGFQLSFVQTAVLLTAVPRAYRWLHFAPSAIELAPRDADSWQVWLARSAWRMTSAVLITCWVCWLAALPLTLYHFGILTPWVWLHSLLLTLPIFAVTIASFLTLPIGLIPVLGDLAARALLWLTNWLLAMVESLAAWPGTLVELRTPPAWLVCGTYVVLGAAARLAFRTPQREARPVAWRRVFVALLSVTAAGWAAFYLAPPMRGGEATVHVLSVGNGSAALVVAPGGQSALVDAGTILNRDAGEIAARAARAMGVLGVEFASASHNNFDHYSGIPTAIRQLAPRRLYTHARFAAALDEGRAALATHLPPASPPFERLALGDRLSLGGIAIEVLWPPDDLRPETSENDRSLVLRMTAHGRRVLFPGDAERVALRGLLRRQEAGEIDLRSDVLIAPHHGSVVPETEAFLAAVLPDVVIVSSGEAREKLRALVAQTLGATCRVVNTDEVGAVRVIIRPTREVDLLTPFAPPNTNEPRDDRSPRGS